MNRKMIGEAIHIRVSDSHETWKCADQELERQIHKSHQTNLGLHQYMKYTDKFSDIVAGAGRRSSKHQSINSSFISRP